VSFGVVERTDNHKATAVFWPLRLCLRSLPSAEQQPFRGRFTRGLKSALLKKTKADPPPAAKDDNQNAKAKTKTNTGDLRSAQNDK
jgi:hypothetical protein